MPRNIPIALLGLLIGSLQMSRSVGADTRTTAWLTQLVQRAVTAGQTAQLSPHLSVLLGLTTQERTTPVRQLGVKLDSALWLFDVCASDHTRIVLMRVGDDHQVEVYRINARGTLLKGVAYEIGGDTRVLTPPQGRTQFLKQRDFWVARTSGPGPTN